MRARNTILLCVMAVELLFLLYCLIRKTNHTIAGYLCAGLSLLLLITTGWLLLFPKYTPLDTTGSYHVAQADYYFTDINRVERYADDGSYRELPVSFWYPENTSDETYPLIVFSHGGFGMKNSNETLYKELASYGYVVCAIDHTYQCLYTKRSDGKRIWLSGEFMKEVSSDDPQKDPLQSFYHFDKWMNIRTADINFVLDNIISECAENASELIVCAMIDTERIGLIGHSLGGSAVLGVGRQREDISAVIALESPYLYDIQGIDEAGNFIFDQSEYPIPVLNVYTDATWAHLREWNQYEQNARLLDMNADDIRNVYFLGIGHFSLTDLSLLSPFLTRIFDGKYQEGTAQEILEKLNILCLSFFDEQIKNQ